MITDLHNILRLKLFYDTRIWGKGRLRHCAIIFLTNQEGVKLMENVRENQIQRTRGKVSKQAQQC